MKQKAIAKEHISNEESKENSSGITSRVSDFLRSKRNNTSSPKAISAYDKIDTNSKSASAKYGRRSSLASQLITNHTPKNIELTDSDYLVPKLAENFDFNNLSDLHQAKLVKSWQSLDSFNESHKGRLNVNSAKSMINQTVADGTSPIMSNGEISSVYNPSFLEENVPNRSKSEMSNYLPFYVYGNIKKVTEKHNLDSINFKMNKSKSSDSIYACTVDILTENDKKYDNGFEQRINRYKEKLVEEERLRENIIQELLSENESVTSSRRRSYDDFSPQQRLYGKNSKYKNRYGDRRASMVNAYDSFGESSDIFIIPKLPSGKTLMIDILSTWGDKHYVGLNGIEVFDANGEISKVKNIYAVPSDVNILPECENDPRLVTNLLDGVNRTQDDMHIWLAPFDSGCSHIITIEFQELTTIAMIRVWNYNKSRIHSYRGVRDILIFLDDMPIFKGEIAKACGGILGGIHHFGDTILFTTDDTILENISKNDTSYSYLTSEPNTPQDNEDRPPTSTLTSNVRPITGIFQEKQSNPRDSSEQILLGASQLVIVILKNWGNPIAVGLTGLEIIEGTDTTLNINPKQLNCTWENNCLYRLINGVNITTKAKNMWIVPYNNEEIVVTIDLNGFRNTNMEL
ncbi:hypothetical protein NQ317_011646 [Molorchus minor]|uniref:KATNIP domain-containing protein n=1 Tax=Molorchus minor TaxID=1323400 RepID=A0ABQ9JAZ6_9CUCU|nr:hypothetical protein NQ317_011646 [Molorchus minor]